MTIYNNSKLFNPIRIEISYIDWRFPSNQIWSADIIEYDEATINKWIEEKVANMLSLDEPLNRYNVYLNGENAGRLVDLVDIIIE